MILLAIGNYNYQYIFFFNLKSLEKRAKCAKTKKSGRGQSPNLEAFKTALKWILKKEYHSISMYLTTRVLDV